METEKRYTTVIKHYQHDQILALVRQKRHTDTDSFGILQYTSKVKYYVFLESKLLYLLNTGLQN